MMPNAKSTSLKVMGAGINMRWREKEEPKGLPTAEAAVVPVAVRAPMVTGEA